MLKKFNYLMTLSICLCFVFAAVGSLIILFPDVSIKIFAYIFAITLVISGLYLLFAVSESFLFLNYLSTGILLCLLGVIVLLNPEALEVIIPIIVGIWVIVSSITDMQIALILKKSNYKNWILTIILSIICVICGVVMIINPQESTLALTTLFGIMLLIYSISNFINLIIFKSNVNDIVKVLK